MFVLDYAWARPSPDQIVATGAVGVARYLSHDNGKRIHPDELAALHAAGLSVLLVWEDGARAAENGAAQGARDAITANAQADNLGWPADRPLHYAVDYDAHNLGVVMDYLHGAANSSVRPVRVYGDYAVVEAAWRAGHGPGWQTLGWSAGRITPHAALIQTVRTPPIPDTDVNVIGDGYTDWGQWPLTPMSVPPAEAEGATVDLLITVDPANRDTELGSYVLLPWGEARRITGGTPGTSAISHGGARQYRLTRAEAAALGWKIQDSPAF